MEEHHLLSAESIATLVGFIASLCFTVQYIPQAWKNYQRKSIHGFSTTGIIIKLIGASFLMSNSILTNENINVVCYGVFGVLQHSLFVLQFSIYPSEEKAGSAPVKSRDQFLWWLLFPLLPILLGVYEPQTLHITHTIKPLTQLISHIPQLRVCIQLKTTSGVSLPSQHLTFVGGLAGLYMCVVIPPVSDMTYLIYVNSILQALSVYMLTVYYDGWQTFVITKDKDTQLVKSNV